MCVRVRIRINVKHQVHKSNRRYIIFMAMRFRRGALDVSSKTSDKNLSRISDLRKWSHFAPIHRSHSSSSLRFGWRALAFARTSLLFCHVACAYVCARLTHMTFVNYSIAIASHHIIRATATKHKEKKKFFSSHAVLAHSFELKNRARLVKFDLDVSECSFVCKLLRVELNLNDTRIRRLTHFYLLISMRRQPH